MIGQLAGPLAGPSSQPPSSFRNFLSQPVTGVTMWEVGKFALIAFGAIWLLRNGVRALTGQKAS